jgi:hypothetical protein
VVWGGEGSGVSKNLKMRSDDQGVWWRWVVRCERVGSGVVVVKTSRLIVMARLWGKGRLGVGGGDGVVGVKT